MTASVELVLLKCPQCSLPVPANEEEVAWVCAQCHQGLKLTSTGLALLTVNWAAAQPGNSQIQWLPFWVFTGTVSFNRRETYSFGSGSQPDKLWSAPRRFYVPAFPLPLEQLQKLGADLTRRQVTLKPSQAVGTLTQCTLLPEDARQTAEFVVLTIEAAHSDKLKSVDFTLNLNDPELWVLPLVGEVGHQSLALAS